MDKWTDPRPADPGATGRAGLRAPTLGGDAHGCSRGAWPGPHARPGHATTLPDAAPSPAAAGAADRTLAWQPTPIFVNYAAVFEL